ncbi:SunT [Clostridium sporogenes]|nr:SunT [Clostridium sporogenes]NFM18546.1 YcxB family protein [Clostridium sporogenes]
MNCLKRKKFKNLDLYYNLKYIFTETNLKIDKKGILLETIFNKKIIKWKYINDNDVLIRSFSDYNILIPESAINSNDNLENLIQIFKENTSKYLQYSYPKNIEFIL